MCVTKSVEKKQTRISKLRIIKVNNFDVKAGFCACNCTGCGFDRHCGGAGCYYKIFDIYKS